ncbi:MAG TPA: UDP-N-acetylmuramoyl-tripeptide--D-alanyl-D-alanine ligase [Mycobacteriales bacterium]|nr:UDP-N-acetylmuramoyl-tripeptide--D-alanyl-D-alanine ligase [Mycobacteriales bacterium]
MIAMSLLEVVRSIGTEVIGSVGLGQQSTRVTGEVVTDSRRVRAGDLFIALQGERTDGHDHAQAALDAGAVAVVAERPVVERALVVPDTLAALQSLAKAVFTRDQPLTFGITGSSGKTSTKDLMGQVLQRYGETLVPEGSFNNEIGLPLTLLRRTEDTSFAVLEYSARGTGHIAFLCGMARPDVAIVLNVGSAHVGEFGSMSATAQAKGELVEAAGRHVVLNADDPLVAEMAARTRRPVTTFGLEGGQVRAGDIRLDEHGRASFELRCPQGSALVRLRAVGAHQVPNALAAAAGILAAGVTEDVARLAVELSEARPLSRWRMEVTERDDGVTVVNDAYNANPESMRAALCTLAALGAEGKRRTWAVLGPMAELGDTAMEAHRQIGRLVAELGIDRLVVVGAEAAEIHVGAALHGFPAAHGIQVADREAATRHLHTGLAPGDVVLVKASRSAGLERVAAAVLEEAA